MVEISTPVLRGQWWRYQLGFKLAYGQNTESSSRWPAVTRSDSGEIPQGTLLGPLHFLLYVSDIGEGVVSIFCTGVSSQQQ